VKLLLDKGANINAKDKNNSTALSLATKNGHKKIVEILKAKGGKTDAAEKKDESGSNNRDLGRTAKFKSL